MGIFLMLITIGGLITAFVLLVISFFTNKSRLKTFVFGAVVVWFVFYAILLFGTSLFSTEKRLALNEPKSFCGFYIDCHLYAALTDVRKTKTLGGKTAHGDFYVVKVKISSDARQAALGLISVDASVTDERKREFNRDIQAEAELGEQPEFERKISPAESFEKRIVFDLPADAENPRLDLREGYGIDHAIETILVGDEDSVLHKRNYFNLGETKFFQANRRDD